MTLKFEQWQGTGSSQYTQEPVRLNAEWIHAYLPTPAGQVPKIKTRLRFQDKWGFIRMRLGLGRMRYTVPPGIYAVGNPGPDSPVFVTANYKMTFDRVRRDMHEIEGWILVLDTKGINVWCAAGKGTFGTEELNRRIRATQLHLIVKHRRLIVPQLGAVGVEAHKVKAATGFRVVYGPVYSKDIKPYLDAGSKVTPEMRRVRFTMQDRIAVAPLEIIPALKYYPWFVLYFVLKTWILHESWLFSAARDAAGLLGAVFAGSFLVPLLLPWIPGRAFSLKGAVAGFVFAMFWNSVTHPGFADGLANVFLYTALAAYLALNFTGASTYTNMTGVYKEMRSSLPFILPAAVIGVILIWF